MGDDYDVKKYPLCAPWHGEQGPAFERIFRPAFEGALHGEADDFCTLHDHLVLRNDPGAPNPAGRGAIGLITPSLILSFQRSVIF